MRCIGLCLALGLTVLFTLPGTAWGRGGGHGGGGHFGGGSHFGGSHFGGGHAGFHSTPAFSRPHFGGGYGGYRGYGGYNGYRGYANWSYYGWGWHRPVYWPAYWMGGYWSPLWPVYETWPFYSTRVADPAVVVNNAVMMAPVEPRYYYHDSQPSADDAAADRVDLTQMEPVFSGPQGAEYNVHHEDQDPPLVLGAASYPTGFAVSAPSSLRFALPGSPGTLKVHFGVMLRSDSACGAVAAPEAHFSIVGDGRELFASDDSGGSTVSVPVGGVRALELRISALGDHPLACAWGIWAEPEITSHP